MPLCFLRAVVLLLCCASFDLRAKSPIWEYVQFCLRAVGVKPTKRIPQVKAIPDSPRTSEARKILSKIRKFENIHEALAADEIDPKTLRNRGDFREEAEGMGFLKLEVAELENGQSVFIKTPKTRELLDGRVVAGHRSMEQLLNLVYWTKFASEMGWGPKYRGLLRTQDGRVAMVTDHIPGSHLSVSHYEMPAMTTEAKRAAKALLREIAEVMTALRVTTHDMQFRIDARGKWFLIDGEYYEPWTNSYPFSFEQAEAMGLVTFPPGRDPRKQTEELRKRIDAESATLP
jgi:hypothetical protein